MWVYLKRGTKSDDENFLGDKKSKKKIEGLKRKVCVFIETKKNIFNPILKYGYIIFSIDKKV